jgi:hypothetical protein
MRNAAIAIACCLGFVFGCGGGGSDKPDAAVDALFSKCGMPGDMGNEMGIGKFCASLGDCTSQTAPLCSVLGDKDTHFCTKTCTNGGPATQCGTGAQCTCNGSNQCGCTPSSCLN